MLEESAAEAAACKLPGPPQRPSRDEHPRRDIGQTSKPGGIDRFKKVLNMNIEQFIKGTIRSDIVETCGVTKVLDAWRMLADRCCPQRLEHLHAQLSRIIAPKKAAAIKDVERAIMEWERDIEKYRLAKPEYVMERDQQFVLLMQLCPATLQAYLRMQKDCLADYDRLRMANHD